MNRECIVAIFAFLIGVLVASLFFVNLIEQNNWLTDKFISDCNRMYGNESWIITEVNGKYACIGNTTIVVPDFPNTPIGGT